MKNARQQKGIANEGMQVIPHWLNILGKYIDIFFAFAYNKNVKKVKNVKRNNRKDDDYGSSKNFQ